MKNCYAMAKAFVCVSLLFVGLSFAQSNEVGQVFNRFSGAEDGVNPASGNASFTKNVAALSAGAASFSLDLSYSGNVTEVVQNKNDVAPTSWVGLGWTLGHARIIVNHAGTMWNGDDSYFLESSAGVRFKILQDENGKWWIEGLPYWLVERETESVTFKGGNGNKKYSIVTGWKLTDDSGIKYTYGDVDYDSISPTRNATEYIIANPYANGIVGVYETGHDVLFPSAWNLQKIEDINANSLSFFYEQFKEKVKKNAYKTHRSYTKEIYLKSIESSQGGKIELETKLKDYEREFIDSKGKIEESESSEPDAFMDPMERRYLSEIRVYGKNGLLLKIVDLCYEPLNVRIGGVQNEDYTKRLLTQIIELDSGKHEIQKEIYAYHKDDLDAETKMPVPLGAIDSVIGPNCGVVKYTYDDMTLADLDGGTGLHAEYVPMTKVSMGMLDNGTPYIVGYRGGVINVYFRKQGKWVFQQKLVDEKGKDVKADPDGIFYIGDNNWFVYRNSNSNGTFYPFKWNGAEWVIGNKFTDYGSHDIAIVGPGYILSAHAAHHEITLRIPWAVWADGSGDVFSTTIDDVDDDDTDREFIKPIASRNHFGVFYKKQNDVGNSGVLHLFSFTSDKGVEESEPMEDLDDDNQYEFIDDNMIVGITEGRWLKDFYAQAYQWKENDNNTGKWVRKHLLKLNGWQGVSSFQAIGEDYFVVKHNDNDDMSLLEYDGEGWNVVFDSKNMVHHQDFDPRTEAEWEAVPGYNFFVARMPRIKKHWYGNEIKPLREYQLYYRKDGEWLHNEEYSSGDKKHEYAGTDWFLVREQKYGFHWDGYNWGDAKDYSKRPDGSESSFMDYDSDKMRSLNGDYFVVDYDNESKIYYKKRDSFNEHISGFFVSKKLVKDPVVDKIVTYQYKYMSSMSGAGSSAKSPVYDYVIKSPIVFAYTITHPDGSITERFLCDEENDVAKGQVCKENFYPPLYHAPTKVVVKKPERHRENNWPKSIYVDRMKSVESTIDNLRKKEIYTYADKINGLVSSTVLYDDNYKKNISETVNVYAAEKYDDLKQENRRTELTATYQCVPDCKGKIVSGTVSEYSSEFDSHWRVKNLWKYTPKKRERNISFDWSSSSSQGANWTNVKKVSRYCDGVACETEDQLGNKASVLYDNKKTGLAHASIANAGLDQVLLLPGNSCNFDSWSECDTVWLTGRELENIPAVTSAAYGRFAKEVLHISKTKKIEGTLEKAKPTKYRFSAWVQGTALNANTEKMQLSLNSSQRTEFTLVGNNTWQYIEWETPSPRSAKKYVLTLSTTDDTDIHLQDVRFVPVDASVGVTFWDMRLSLPIANVDDRGVGSYVERDASGRPVESYGELSDGSIFLKNKITYIPGTCAVSSEMNYALDKLIINKRNVPISTVPGEIEFTVPNNTDELDVSWKTIVPGERVYYRLYEANLSKAPDYGGDCCSASESLIKDMTNETMILEVAVSNEDKPYKVIISKSTKGWVDYGSKLTEGFNPTYVSGDDVSSVRYLTEDGIRKALYTVTDWTDYDSEKREGKFIEMVGSMNNGTDYIAALPNYIGMDIDEALNDSAMNEYVTLTIGKNALGYLASSSGFSNYGAIEGVGVKSTKHRIATSKDNKTYIIYERTGYSEVESDLNNHKDAGELDSYDKNKKSILISTSLVAKYWNGNNMTSMGSVSDAPVDDADITVDKNNVPFVAYIGTSAGQKHTEKLVVNPNLDDSDDDPDDLPDGWVEYSYEEYDHAVIIKHYSSTKKKWIGFKSDDGDVLELPDGSPLLNADKLKLTANGAGVYLAVLQKDDHSSQYALRVFKLTQSNSKLVATELVDKTFGSGVIAYLQENDHFDLEVNDSYPFVSFENEDNRGMLSVVKYDGTNWMSVGRPAFAHVSIKRNSADLALKAGAPYVVLRENANSSNKKRRNKIVPMKYSSTGDKDLTIKSIAPIQGTDLATSFRQYILNYSATVDADVESIILDLNFRTKGDVLAITVQNTDGIVYAWKKSAAVGVVDTENITSQIPKMTIPLKNGDNELSVNVFGENGIAPLTYSFAIKREYVPGFAFKVNSLSAEVGKLVLPRSSVSMTSSSSISGMSSSSSVSMSTPSKENYVYQIISSDDGSGENGDDDIKNICLEFNSAWVMYIYDVLFSKPVCLDYDMKNEKFIISSSSYSSSSSKISSSSSTSTSSSSAKGNRIIFYDGDGNTKIVDVLIMSSSSPAVPVSSSFDISEWLGSSSSGTSGASSSGSSNASSSGSSGASSGGSSGVSSGGSSNASSSGSSGASSGGSSGTSSGGSSNTSSSANVSSSSAVVSSSSFKHDSQLGDVIDGTAIPYDYYVLFGYKFIATSNLNFENTVSASSGYYVTTNSNVAAGAKISGTIMCSGNLTLNSGSYVEAVVQGGSLNMQSGARYGSKTQRPVNVPSIPKKSFATGNENINVWSGQSRTLSPGTYGDVSVYSNAKLTLESGVYYFKSFNVYADGSVIPKKSSTLVQLWVKNNISLGDRTSIMKSHSPNKLFIYGNSTSDMYVGVESETFANIVYPNGKVNLAPRSSFKGKVWSKFITSGANSVVK